MILVLFGSICIVFFAYFGYPLTLLIMRLFHGRIISKALYTPPITLIITAFNEEKRIREKLENSLAQNYPREKLQILVASDGSTDATNQIVVEYIARGVELLPVKNRAGKENAQKEAVQVARGDILVFSDVATRIEPDALQKMMANFADPTVGCVSSEDRVIGSDGKPCGEGAYVRYEMWLRNLEASVSSLVGLSGSFFAARRDVCRDFSADMQSDFRTVLNSVKLGLRGVNDPEVIGYYPDVADPAREFDRKVRTVLRGITVFFRNLEFLNIFRYGLFAYLYFCHKLLRWLVPFFLLVALLANLMASVNSTLSLMILAPHLLFYGLAVAGWRSKQLQSSVVVKIPLYFLTVNMAIAVAWWRYACGKRMVMWAPSQR